MPSAGFEPAIPASERPQTYTLDGVAIGISLKVALSSGNMPSILYFSYYSWFDLERINPYPANVDKRVS
jgi:hypothetical protein